MHTHEIKADDRNEKEFYRLGNSIFHFFIQKIFKQICLHTRLIFLSPFLNVLMLVKMNLLYRRQNVRHILIDNDEV